MRRALLVMATAACGGGSGGSGGDFATAADAVVGIYNVGDLTRTEGGCFEGGVSILQQDTFAVAFVESAFGFELLTVLSCADPQNCRDKAANRNGVAIDFSYTVQFLEDNGDLTGEGASTGFDMNGTCTDGEVFDTTLTLDTGALRVEKAIVIADDYPADSEGFCTTDRARDAAVGNLCFAFEVLTATFAEEL
jgi:hypothetical protein